MSSFDSYRAPHQRSKFLIDFWVEIYKLKDKFSAKRIPQKIPTFFSPYNIKDSESVDSNCCVNIFDTDIAAGNLRVLSDIISETYAELHSVRQALEMLQNSMKKELTTQQVTRCQMKKNIAQLSTENISVIDVMSVEYRVCCGVVSILQSEYEEILSLLDLEIRRALDQIKTVLCGALIELFPSSLTLQTIDESGLLSQSSSNFLSNWEAFISSQEQLNDVDGGRPKSIMKQRSNSLLQAFSSVTSPTATTPTISSDTKQFNSLDHNSHVQNVKALSVVHEAYLKTVSSISHSYSPFYFKNLLLNKAADYNEQDLLSDDTFQPNTRPPSTHPPSTSKETSSSPLGLSSSPVLSSHVNRDRYMFITASEISAVELDHEVIYRVLVNRNGQSIYNTSNVRLFSWYMYVVMNNSECVAEKLRQISITHEACRSSRDEHTDRTCMRDYVRVGADLLEGLTATSQVVVRLKNLFTEEEAEETNDNQVIILKLFLFVTDRWLKEAQFSHKAFTHFNKMRRKKISKMLRNVIPSCTDAEVEAVMKRDNGALPHKLIAAIHQGYTDLFQLLESRLSGPFSETYNAMKLYADHSKYVLNELEALYEHPVQYLKC